MRNTTSELKDGLYLTIRLRARDFYEAIVDEDDAAQISYHLIGIESK